MHSVSLVSPVSLRRSKGGGHCGARGRDDHRTLCTCIRTFPHHNTPALHHRIIKTLQHSTLHQTQQSCTSPPLTASYSTLLHPITTSYTHSYTTPLPHTATLTQNYHKTILELTIQPELSIQLPIQDIFHISKLFHGWKIL